MAVVTVTSRLAYLGERHPGPRVELLDKDERVIAVQTVTEEHAALGGIDVIFDVVGSPVWAQLVTEDELMVRIKVEMPARVQPGEQFRVSVRVEI